MSRYIDADALIDDLIHNRSFYPALVASAIKNTPTADVVSVVRCKECKFWGITHAHDIEKSHYCCRDNMWCMPLRFADDFCSYGKRREANDSTETIEINGYNIGKSVFLTKEEAEKALAERSENGTH